MVSCRWVFIAIARLKGLGIFNCVPQKRWLTFWALKGRNHQVLLKNRIDNSWSKSYFKKKQLRNVDVILMRWMNSRCSFAQDEWCVFFQKPCGSPCEMRIMNPSKPSIMHFWDWLRRFWKACLAFCTAVAADCGDSWCKIFKTLCVFAVEMKCYQRVVTKNEPGNNRLSCCLSSWICKTFLSSIVKKDVNTKYLATIFFGPKGSWDLFGAKKKLEFVWVECWGGNWF